MSVSLKKKNEKEVWEERLRGGPEKGPHEDGGRHWGDMAPARRAGDGQEPWCPTSSLQAEREWISAVFSHPTCGPLSHPWEANTQSDHQPVHTQTCPSRVTTLSLTCLPQASWTMTCVSDADEDSKYGTVTRTSAIEAGFKSPTWPSLRQRCLTFLFCPRPGVPSLNEMILSTSWD